MQGSTDDVIIVNVWCKIQIIALAKSVFSFFVPSKLIDKHFLDNVILKTDNFDVKSRKKGIVAHKPKGDFNGIFQFLDPGLIEKKNCRKQTLIVTSGSFKDAFHRDAKDKKLFT